MLRKKTIQGIYWTTGAQIATQLFQIIFTAVLARTLVPEDFGLLSMALIFTKFINMIKSLGLGNAIIQKKEVSQDELSSVYWLSVIFSLFLALVLGFIAPLGAWFYNEPVLLYLIIFLAGNLFLSTFSNFHISLFSKELKFKNIAIVEVSSMLISNIIAISLAYLGYGLWSLVIRILLNTSLSIIFTRILSNWKPDYHFKIKETYKFLKFGVYYSFSGIFYFFTQNIDFILIGKFYGSYALGFYTIAFNLAVMPGEQIKYIFTRVLSSSFAKISENKEKFHVVFNNIFYYYLLILFPITIGLALVSHELILTIYSKKWIESAYILPTLAGVGFFRGILHLVTSAINASGDSRFTFFTHVLQSVFMVVGIFIAAFYYNIQTVCIVYVTVQGAICIYSYRYLFTKYFKTSVFSFLVSLYKPLFYCIIMSCGVFLFKFFIQIYRIDISVILQLLVLTTIGAAIYGFMIYFFEGRIFITKALQIIRNNE